MPAAVARMVEHLRANPDTRRVYIPHRKPIAADVIVSGSKRHLLTFHLRDRAWFRVNTETRECHIQLKAKALWAWGWEDAASKYVGLATWMMRGVFVDVWDAHRYGWSVTGIELCADFEDLRFVREDAPHFIGGRLSGDYNPGDPIETWGASEGDHHDGTPVETIMVGRRTTSPVSLCIYDKRRQIQSVKAGDGSTYHPAWTAAGWDGVAGVTRVELRATGRALELENDETGEVIDLRTPRSLCSRSTVDAAWYVLCAKRRLTVPGSATRRERRDTDPRWAYVTGAPIVTEPPDERGWRQSRAVQAGTHAERVRRSQRAALRGLARWGALHGMDPSMFDDVGDLLRVIAMVCTPAEVDDARAYMEKYSEDQEIIADEIAIASARVADPRLRHRDRLPS